MYVMRLSSICCTLDIWQCYISTCALTTALWPSLFLSPFPRRVPYGNIMYDRRIIRGNTYALHSLPAVSALC